VCFDKSLTGPGARKNELEVRTMQRLTGKVALVTGGSSGIGRAAAFAFAREGAKVVLAARGAERGERVAHEIQAAGGQAEFVRTDMSSPSDIEAVVQRTLDLRARLDFAFNNAAPTEVRLSRTADVAEEEFDHLMAVNLKGFWLCMKHEIRAMLRQVPAGGAIVNTSSVNGLGGARMGGVYSATKSGILALTKSAAQEYAREGIRVNALVAGAFQTPVLESAMDSSAGAQGVARDAVAAQYCQFIPQGRIGRPEEAAEVVVWLCSDAASYVTGHPMIVDGGMTASTR
jgi:NAD(P)-dependent dehydrogenase (short-subunit alcohol dehydrogenase family)